MRDLSDALQKISIHDLFIHFGFPLPKSIHPDKPFLTHSPFRPDEHPSFSVFKRDESWLFKDMSPAYCQYKGNALTFFRLASGITDKKLSVREFCKLAQSKPGVMNRAPCSNAIRHDLNRTSNSPSTTHHSKPQLAMRLPTSVELMAISRQRGDLRITALQEAVKRGHLRIGTLYGFKSWLLTDASGKVIQGRRIDRNTPSRYPFARLKYPKAMNAKHSDPNWPLGILETENYPNVILVEGGPDFLSAFHWLEREGILDQTQPIAFLGGENSFTPETSARLVNKRVMMFPHADPAGSHSEAVWKQALDSAGVCDLKIMDFRRIASLSQIGGPVKDLNDLVAYEKHIGKGRLFAFFGAPQFPNRTFSTRASQSHYYSRGIQAAETDPRPNTGNTLG